MERLKAWFQGYASWRSISFAGALVAMLLVIVLIAILRISAPSSSTPGGVAQRAPVGVVAVVRGTLELQREGWNAFVPVSTGASLRVGDQVRLAPGAQTRIVCADAVVVDLREGTTPNPCRSQDGWIFDITRTPWANTVLSADDARIPKVIAPRATALLTTTPTIRWSAVEGAETYTVILRREAEEVWRVTVRGTTTLDYPADQPPLERGPMYRFVVSADDGLRENAQGAGVVVLTEREVQEVAAEVRRLEQLAVDDATRRLVLANLYASRGLYADALALLEGLTNSPAQPAPLRLLGDIYLAIGLPDLAAAPYTQARDVAAQTGDRLAQAQANRMLGTVYSRLGSEENRKRTVEHYQRALQFYEEVGDAAAQKELRQLLSALE